MADQVTKQTLLTRVAYETLLQAIVFVICFLLGLAISWQIVFSVILACLGFAFPDVVTALLVKRLETDRDHGCALFFFFTAFGFIRASIIGAALTVGALIVGLVLIPLDAGLVLLSALVAFWLVFIFLSLVFPLVLLGTRFAKRSEALVYFCHDLTRWRSVSPARRSKIHLDPTRSLKWLAMGSTASLAICSIGVQVVIAGGLVAARIEPPLAVMMVIHFGATYFLPIGWFVYFSARVIDRWNRQ